MSSALRFVAPRHPSASLGPLHIPPSASLVTLLGPSLCSCTVGMPTLRGGEATQPALTCCPFLPSNGWLRPSKLHPHAPMTLRITLSVAVGCHLRPPHPSAPELCHLCTPTSGPF